MELLAPTISTPAPFKPDTPEAVTATKLPRIRLLSPAALMLALIPKTTFLAAGAVPPITLLLELESQTPTPRLGPLVACAFPAGLTPIKLPSIILLPPVLTNNCANEAPEV